MKHQWAFYALLAFLFSACGFKGNLYLPDGNDKARYGIWQSGWDQSSPTPQAQPQSDSSDSTIKEQSDNE